MKRKIGRSIILLLILIVFLPVLIKALIPKDRRVYTGVTLSETNYEEISFINREQDLNLSGLIFRPKGDGPFPTAVIIHGSGTSRRDNIWYLTLVNHLQQQGIMVLLPDKRGSEKSEGNWMESSFEDLATDTHAAIDFLKRVYNEDIEFLGVIGMSQGGHIAPIIAKNEPELDFMVNMSGATVSMHQQFLYEENNNLREFGFLPGISNALSYLTTYYHRELGSNKVFWNAIGNYNPYDDWKSIDKPTFIIYGEDDTNVPVKNSQSVIESLNNDWIKVKIYPGSGHAIQEPEAVGNQIIREEVLDDITSFIKSYNL